MALPSKKRQAIIALLLLAPVPAFGVTAAMVVAPGSTGQTVYFLCKVWLLLFPILWWTRVQHGAPSLSPPTQGGLGAGLLLGLAISGAIFGLYALLNSLGIDLVDKVRAAARQNGLDSPGRYLLLSAYIVVVNSLLEEYVWRWFVYRQCVQLIGVRLALWASALLFSLHHLIALRVQFDWPLALLATAGVGLGGLIWSRCYQRYNSIWPGYLCHALIDIAILAIGYHLIFGILS